VCVGLSTFFASLSSPTHSLSYSLSLSSKQKTKQKCEFIGHLNSLSVLPLWLLQSWGMIGAQLGMVFSGFMYGAKEMTSFGWIGSSALGIQAAIWVSCIIV